MTHIHSYPSPIDLKQFTEDVSASTEVKYGLPKDVMFCKRCVISNQRPNSAVEFKHTAKSAKQTINFNGEGLCDACRVAELKAAIDWEERDHKLRALCDRFRSRNGSYDCIVPGSGGKDSFYTAHLLKYKYGMNPLTITWAPHIYTEWGWKNFQAWIHAGFDNHLVTPNGRVHRLLTRLATENLLHPFQPFMIGQKAISPKMALLHRIPLVFYGETEAEYGNPSQGIEQAKQSWDYFSTGADTEVLLGGETVADLKSKYGLHAGDLEPYMPADPSQLADMGLEVHYMGYYIKWHPQGCYYYSVENGGFQAAPERNPGTYGKYASLDDKMDDLHFYTTYVKFGIGHATYDAAQEIRSGELTRSEGVSLVKRFDGEFPERFASELFQYLSLPENEFPVAAKMFQQPIFDRKYFSALVDQFRSPHLWKYVDDNWVLRSTVTEA